MNYRVLKALELAKPRENRVWIVDAFRGSAVICMIIFHSFYDLRMFGIYELSSDFFWISFPRIIASSFLFLVGLSMSLSYSRVEEMPFKLISRKYAARACKLMGYACAISLASWIYDPSRMISFGILHMISISILLCFPMMRFPCILLPVGIAFILSYPLTHPLENPWLLWAGFPPYGYSSFDYVPLIPWFGFVCLGGFSGWMLRKHLIPSQFHIPVLCHLGRFSLLVYLIHQPLLILIIQIGLQLPLL